MSKITFEIEEKEYELPEFLTIGNYMKIFKYKSLFDDEYFAAKIINLITGCPLEELLEVNFTQIQYLASYILTLFPKDNTFHNSFELDGVEYGFIPSWKELSYGEYVDLDTLFGNKDELIKNIHVLMAIMYRPIIKKKKKDHIIEKYNVDKMVERSELFKEKLDIKYFAGASFFLQVFAKKYQLHIHRFLMNPTLKQKIKFIWKNRKIINKLHFLKNGDGGLSQTKLLMMISPNMIKSTKRKWWKF